MLRLRAGVVSHQRPRRVRPDATDLVETQVVRFSIKMQRVDEQGHCLANPARVPSRHPAPGSISTSAAARQFSFRMCLVRLEGTVTVVRPGCTDRRAPCSRSSTISAQTGPPRIEMPDVQVNRVVASDIDLAFLRMLPSRPLLGAPSASLDSLLGAPIGEESPGSVDGSPGVAAPARARGGVLPRRAARNDAIASTDRWADQQRAIPVFIDDTSFVTTPVMADVAPIWSPELGRTEMRVSTPPPAWRKRLLRAASNVEPVS